MRLFGIPKVQAIRGADWNRARTSHIPCGFSNGVHCAETRIKIAPAAVAIEDHGQPTLRAFDANHTSIAGSGAFDRVGLHHGIVLLPDVALTADVWAGEQALQIVCEIS